MKTIEKLVGKKPDDTAKKVLDKVKASAKSKIMIINAKTKDNETAHLHISKQGL
jgi:hypothetical protein